MVKVISSNGNTTIITGTFKPKYAGVPGGQVKSVSISPGTRDGQVITPADTTESIREKEARIVMASIDAQRRQLEQERYIQENITKASKAEQAASMSFQRDSRFTTPSVFNPAQKSMTEKFLLRKPSDVGMATIKAKGRDKTQVPTISLIRQELPTSVITRSGNLLKSYFSDANISKVKDPVTGEVMIREGVVVGFPGAGTAFQFGKKAFQKASKSYIGRFLGLSALQAAAAEGIPRAGFEIAKATAPANIKKEFQRSDIKDTLGRAIRAERAAVSGITLAEGQQSPTFGQKLSAGGRSFLYDVTTVGSGKENIFVEEFTKAGFSKEAAMRARRQLQISEATSFLTIEAISNAYGRSFLKSGLQQAGIKSITPKTKGLFSVGFKALAPVGFVEGAASVRAQEVSRAQPFSATDILIGGGVGSLTAGTLGGGIIATKPGRKALSKTLEIGGYVLDPYEYPGDILEAGIRKGARSARKLPGVFGFAPSFSFGQTIVPSETPATEKRGRKPSVVPSDIFNFGETPSETDTNTFQDVFGEVPSDVPTYSFSFTPAQTSAFTQSKTDTNVNTFSDVFNFASTVPVVTPFPRIPPPFPLALPTQPSGNGRGTRKSTKAYLNELAAGQALFSGLVDPRARFRKGFGLAPIKKTKKRRKK